MSIVETLPPSLNLPPHLSAHKYFLVCTLTVAAWDTLVLTPRTWRLIKTTGWPTLKVLFHFLRVFMPIEFAIVAVAFFDTRWSQATCDKFYLFEPICTAILLAAASGQGCIAGPKHDWVGIYWVAPTLFYTVSFALALMRSIKSLESKHLSPWKLMLRDGLNLYGAIFLVNLTNMVFWFAITPTNTQDTIKTIVTSIAAVLTTSMTLRIILSVRGSLVHGGSFALSASQTNSSRTTHVISTRNGGGIPTNVSTHNAGHTYTLDDMRSKTEADWSTNDKSSDSEAKPAILDGADNEHMQHNPSVGVKITIDRQVGYDDDAYVAK
ncbi:hypothetical protein H0H92_009910 [Tricholoma furcatifolium]|nr:hypothetical protein H0H92_009910 [Tricholoma furcatifolium]